ncbi:hypothetical protein FSP39_000469 [Pinctada imbricata]|uniref:Beta-lactamase-related domain-containing protein n=1 Tax=Pinctada imbricata TaxID=66713 RepID=A0AA89BUF6_PINIB|nr:hypothetical protein FSP39_000469 [Pinctada imbricata]
MKPSFHLYLMSFTLVKWQVFGWHDQDIREVESVLSKVLQCRLNFPGMAVSVVKDGRILMAKGYGYLDTSKRSPVTNRTLFQISSLTKAFAGTLLLKQLKENTNFSIYSKLTEILGNNFKFSKDLWTQEADLKDLMSMNLAIPGHNGMRLHTSVTRKNLPSRMQYLEPIYGFRTKFLYGNLNYGLVTHMSENIAGKRWENLIQKEIFDPLGMSSSTFFTSDKLEAEKDIATGYDRGHDRIVAVPREFSRIFTTLCGSNCILSNVIDMAKWMMVHLRRGKNEHGKQIIDSDIVDLTHHPWTLIKVSKLSWLFTQPDVPVSTTESSYGLGWKNGHYRGHRIYHHSGSSYGYSAFITLFPDQDMGIFVAMNGRDDYYMIRTLLINYLSDVFLGVQPWLNESTICTFPHPFHNKVPKSETITIDRSLESTRPLPEYEGAYYLDAYGKLSVTYNVTSRRLNIEFGIGRWTLYPASIPYKFHGLAEGIMHEFWDLENIQFQSSCKKCPISSVAIERFEKKHPPVFKRVLINGMSACPEYRK